LVFRHFGYQEVEGSRNWCSRNCEVPKCETLKEFRGIAVDQPFWHFRDRRIEKAKALDIKTQGVPKLEIPFQKKIGGHI
jgi:hypothetical protein